MNKIIKARIYNNRYIYLPIKVIRTLNLNKNYVILFRINDTICSIGKVIKVNRKRKSQVSYFLCIRKSILKKLKLENIVKIKILEMKKIGYKPPIIKISDKILDVISLIPNDDRFTCIILSEKNILVYYLNNRATSVAILPRFIELNDFILWNIGFYLAEGLKTNFHRISVSNDDSRLIKQFINYLKLLNVNENDLHVDIRVKPENYSEFLKNYWSEELKISLERIKVRKVFNKPTSAKHGNVEINIYNTVLGIIHGNLINLITKSYDIFSKNQLLALIKGIEDGDGHVMLHKGSIEIGVTCEKNFSKLVNNIYTKLYSKPYSIQHSTSNKVDRIYFTGTKNALKFLLDNHFNEHMEKRIKLIKLLRFFMRKDLKYLQLLKTEKPVRSLSDKAGVTFRAANEILKKYVKEDIVKVNKIKVISKIKKRSLDIRVFKLTEKGRDIVKYLHI